MDFKIKEIQTSLTSFDIFSIFKDYKEVIFLDSAKLDSSFSNYSFLGLNPYKTLKSKNGALFLNDNKVLGDPFLLLEKEIKEYSIPNYTLPLAAGALGYISYDAHVYIEEINSSALEDIKIPEIYFNFYDNLIIFDHQNSKTYISAMGILNDSSESIKEIKNLIEKNSTVSKSELMDENNEFFSNFTREEYLSTVDKLKSYIESGDVYIANLTQRFNCKTHKTSFDIYKELRTTNPAPFAAYLSFEDFQVISSSPERFMKINKGIVETRPIKGTRPRGSTTEEDENNKNQLLSSEKDKSELLMIVDLERNDLSKVCKPFTVKVTELFKLEEYSTVFHLVATIIGELRDDISSIKCIRECFPGGSITGAPKIRAMEVIDELEKIKRNIYTGAIGYFDFNGNADFNIVIRTIFKQNNNAYFGVGGGITWESEREAEYEETLDKAKSLMRVLR